MNWEQRVKRANKAKSFTDEDKTLSKLWVTGPISEFADQVELKEGLLCKGPKDIYIILDELYFAKGVDEDDVDLATNCYYSIVKQVEALAEGRDRTTILKKFLGKHYK